MSRVALILYSNFATVIAQLGEETASASFNTLVDGLPYEGGLARMDRALRLASSAIFDPKTANRRNVPKILILLSGGKQTTARDAVSLEDASHHLHKAGVRILSIGMGNNVDFQEFRPISQREEDIFLAPSFDDLLRLSGSISKIICEASSK